ncbi:hypothetical protein [Pseudosulfitobacter sp. SM2401]|uniref:hypothetical protein n=1 Tax=Pseudosulfitobacter sp. SM2401 TaxID=3350098 RepID=UPI0036F3AFD9
MKPTFALSLSFEGIRLLHRAADGWRVVGDVALDTADLHADLAALRATADGLEPDGIATKLIVPNDQIRYLKLETGDVSNGDRRAAAEIGLNGATPYPIEELAYDISIDGPTTYVAAVARETLAEAEAFAAEHQFNPLSCVAIPENDRFVGEPFFGQTKDAPADVERDTAAIVIVAGDPIPNVVEPEPVAEIAVKDPETVAPVKPAAEPQGPVVPVVPPADTKPVVEPTPSVGFASRRAPDNQDAKPAPKLSGASRTNAPEIASTPVTTVSAPSLPVDPDAAPPIVAMAAPPEAQSHPDASVDGAPEPSITAGFLSRRKTPGTVKAAGPIKTAPKTEAQRMTIFGARKSDTVAVGGKPRFLGLMLMAALLVMLAGVAAWASVFMDEGLARFFGPSRSEQVATAPESLLPDTSGENAATFTTASLGTGLSPEDQAVLDALRNPIAEPQTDLPQLSQTELESLYAVTGIWPKAPQVPVPAALVPLDDLYVTGIDPVSSANDAVALPDAESYATDRVPGALAAPAAAGTAFALDDRGLVIPTPEGAVSPDGVVVYAGRPASVPPKTPTRFEQTPDLNAETREIAKIRPRDRPGDLVERNERSNLGGLTRTELAELRPRLRPALENAEEEKIEDEKAVQTPNPQAVVASRRPDGRPRNFARIVDRAIKAKPQETEATRVAAVAPRTVTPKIPTKTSVAKEATVRNAIKFGRVNLIGVYGKPSSRRALVRLANGRYQKVQVGDRIDGGRVSAIGDSELRYKKGSRNLVLKMPKG